MNEVRVLRLIRELRCDPLTNWFEALFGIAEGATTQIPVVTAIAPEPVAVADEEDEGWLM